MRPGVLGGVKQASLRSRRGARAAPPGRPCARRGASHRWLIEQAATMQVSKVEKAALRVVALCSSPTLSHAPPASEWHRCRSRFTAPRHRNQVGTPILCCVDLRLNTRLFLRHGVELLIGSISLVLAALWGTPPSGGVRSAALADPPRPGAATVPRPKHRRCHPGISSS
jgi:hypothetical protein